MKKESFAQMTVIAPGIIHIDLQFTNRVLPFSYNFGNNTVLHIKDDELIVDQIDNAWLRRFASHMKAVSKGNDT